MSVKRIIKRTQKQLITHLTAKEEDYQCMGTTIETIDGPLIYIDRGANILAVAHLDYVMETEPLVIGNRVYCPQLDDRLGVFTLLALLPKLGCQPFDILLTTNEEKGRSTAGSFENDKQYRYVFEFDRAGTDVVMYDYEDDEMLELCQDFGWKVGIGSFTDISCLEHLGCKAFNIGVGYHGQHSVSCYADLTDTVLQSQKFVRFMAHIDDVYGDDHILSHVERPKPTYSFGKSYGGSYDWRKNSSWPTRDYSSTPEYCSTCYEPLERLWRYCPHCGDPVLAAEPEYD